MSKGSKDSKDASKKSYSKTFTGSTLSAVVTDSSLLQSRLSRIKGNRTDMSKSRFSIKQRSLAEEVGKGPLYDRGYYSELVTDLGLPMDEKIKAGNRKPAYLWEVATTRHSPTIKEWKPDIIQKILAPAERWMCFEEEKTISFPVDVFKPKVQLEFDSEPYKVPRSVAIEKRRRLYETQNWQDCLKEMNITPLEILPVDVIDREWIGVKFGLYTMIHWLPLEWFDDEEYSTKSPQGWLDHGLIDGISHPVPAVAFIPVPQPELIPSAQRLNSLYDWINVAVLTWDEMKKRFKVLTLDGFKRMMYLPEIYILFGAEEPMRSARRLRAAINLRNDAEKMIRWEYVLDSQVLTGIYEIPEDWIKKMKTMAITGKAKKNIANLGFNTLVDEIQLNHKRKLGELEFRWSVNNTPDQYKFIDVPPLIEEKVKEKGRINTGITHFGAKRTYFGWYTIYVLPNSFCAMQNVVAECLKAEQMTLFTMSYGKLVTLDEFETIQNKFTTTVMKYLKYTWIDSTAFNLRMCISDCGKGWFDINEHVHQIYDIAKLNRLFECVKFRMQYALRVIIENSVQQFATLLETPCMSCNHIEEDFEWGFDLINSPFLPSVPPIFTMILRLSETSAYYSTDPDQYEKTLLKLYDQAIVSTHSIKQIHPSVLARLRFANDLYLTSVGLLEDNIAELRDKFLRGYRKSVIPLKAYAKEFEEYLEFWNMNIVNYLQQYKDESHTAPEVKEEVNFHIHMKENLEATIPASIIIGPFFINTDSVKQLLIAKRVDVSKKLLDQFAERMKTLFAEIIEDYKTIQLKLAEKPNSIESIYDIRDWMETIPMTVRQLDETTKRLNLEYEILDIFWYNLPQEDFDQKWDAVAWPSKINRYIDETNEVLIEETEKFLKIQLQDEANLQERIEALIIQVSGMYKYSDASKCSDIAIEMRRVWKQIKEAQEQGQLLNSRQKLFLIPVVPFDALAKLIKEFEPYKNMWTTAADWLSWHEIWMDNPLSQIDGEGIDVLVSDMYKTMMKSIRLFVDFPKVQAVAVTIKEQIEQFKPLIPIIQSLRNPGMRDRHWEQFHQETGLDIPWGPLITFNQCIDYGISKFAEDIVRISEYATKEFSIEQTLDKMAAEWEDCNLELALYKQTGTYIMKVSDEIQQMLDDHIVLAQQLSFSPFKAALSQQIDDWEEALKITYDVIEEWIDVQRQWMYLEPIFSSDDISKQLPVETKKYLSMERTWKRIMRSAYEKPKIIEFCADKKLLESLKDANHILEVVQKGLAEYLELKRSVFPRLYFLSDDELLEILSQARNPLAVQPHLRKCFENIARLYFEPDLRITQMFSGEGECVDFEEPMYPTGNVEYWLLQVEKIMKATIRAILGASLATIKGKDRKDWVLEWPGQVVIAGCQTYWTSGVEDGINSNTLGKFFQIVLKNLDSLRSLVKGGLSFLQREVLSALIVIEVHARDVTQTLVDNNVANVNDFDWISQLRYYWVNDDMKVRAVNAEFQYGYEYLGNSGRLVITPLTDRCYLTLTGALHLKFGGAPAGPAGTGKTETTKDLAKAMAIQCVVFNCSDQLDFIYMGKFFKGLASSGAWACFDEFNRIDIEVLSVIAQQIMTIQKAQQARLDRFIFEGCEIALRDSAAVFITMNPGYAGRTELPDNLKALFRPVAMMVPNYTLIAEISLFSFGFGNAKPLANKITTTFKLSSEQLSSQDHYDFGMRAVKTVIAVAGNLKREKPGMDERQIVLRAIRDVNVPKFLKDDLKLFNGIVSDLFPKMIEEVVDYGALELSIRACLIEAQLEDVDDYVKKVIQLYETTVVRHGLMLVGPTGSGKTCCYETLKHAMTQLSIKGKITPAGSPFCKVFTFVLNPKSITMGQLYGEFDLQTHEWTDGILPSLVRIGVASTSDDKAWYVFDGPVDAVWIENMNSVLDDNKKLCLSSGEIIKLRDTQTMIFEVADLAVASPATVSRCGMVYLEPGVLGLEPYVNCWLKRLPALAAEYTDLLHDLIDTYLYSALNFVRTFLREILTSIDSAMVTTFLHMLDYRLTPLTGKDNKPPPAPQFLKFLPDLMIPWVMFSLVWSIGCTCDNDGRVRFNEWLRQKMVENKHKPLFPEHGLVYDYKLHDGGFTDPTVDGNAKPPSWHHWMENAEEFKITVDMKYSDIEIPTIDNIRNAELIGMILLNEKNVLCVGPTGTGKTLTMIRKLSQNMHKKFICDFINFSARTSSNQTQDLIDSKLDRRRKGVYGPPVLKRQVFFIDDFNMPALEVYGAQPPIELIRQWMDFSGWYDRKNIGDFRYIIDVNFAAAMGPPGGGRNPVTARLLRHFHYLTFLEFEDLVKKEIFGQICSFWVNRTKFQNFYESILNGSLNIYNTICEELLPTPAKTHYTFNLRDLSKVFQGVLMADPESIESVEQIIRLWYHENCRVYQDRLVNDEDRQWFDELLKKKIVEFKYSVDACLGNDVLFYGDFTESSDLRPYIQITNFKQLSKILNNFLEDYNTQTTSPMKLVLFMDAMQHVCRICRIIRQPMGNALLLGMGGSGRQSLTRLASHISEFSCFQIELSKAYGVTEWREDVKNLMLKSGLAQRETVFLFSDTQIKNDLFLEDLNNMLNSGDVPNCYPPEDMDKIYQGMKGILTEMGIVATKSNLFSVYQRQVRMNLHTVISMSPIGEIFRARLRQFPALVNCCTIDWFSPWPNTALQSVAKQYLLEIPELQVTATVLDGIVQVCQFMHASVVTASEQFLAELSRHNYVTPTSYLQLLSSYTNLMKRKKGGLTEGIGRLKTGLFKLQATSEEVKDLQEQLKQMKPALEIAAADAEVMINKIAADTKIAEQTREIVEKEEEEAAKKAIETQTIADDAARDLEAAMPALLAAEKSLQALNKNDITEVRAMKRPPVGVIFVIESICIVKGVKPNKVPGQKPGEKLLDYWEPGRAMLTDPGVFLTSLMNFDKDSITEDMIQKLDKYVNDPNFLPAKIIKVSKACTSLCMWVHAMYKYYFVNLQVAPKKAALKQANEELAITEAALAKARAQMKEIMDGLEVLNEKLQTKMAFKAEKEASINVCQERMNRAVRLISGLADERVRWIQTIENIERSTVNVTGDILICSGAVAYLTPFTDSYRKDLFTKWLSLLKDVNVPHSEKCDPVSVLGEPVVIRSWQIDGLPRDALSTENAVLVSCSKRWPLFIDPQGQANKWIRNMEKPRGLAICKLADKDLVRTLELAIRFGKPVLIENVMTELDPSIDPVLYKSLFKQGGQWMLKLGDSIVPYNDDFQLYITTKLTNPHYTPEVSIKVQLVNFTVVPTGLQDQLLALVVMQERPDLEEQRSQIVISSAQMKQELKEIEDRILMKLSSSEGSPLDDIDFITTLEASKIKSEDIKSKVEAAEITQIDIDNTRMQYVPVANRGQILFFCVADLSNVDPMYQYSLEWFINTFINSMAETEKTDNLNERVRIINDYFTYSLYGNVCRSLFAKDKLLFAFLLCIRIMMSENKIDAKEWLMFLAGGSPNVDLPNPCPSWLTEKAWKEVLSLLHLPNFRKFVDTFQKHQDYYKKIFESPQPHRENLPEELKSDINIFRKLIILKSLRPDKITNAMQDFLVEEMGQQYIEPITSDLSAMYKESAPTVPLIFVLSTGTDPAYDLFKFADKMKMTKRTFAISLGQGQGPLAERLIHEGVEIGNWVFFQNCHLAPSFMPRLERVIDEIEPEAAHKEFRIWLTSTPSPHFPVAILQNGSKMTVEPPKGLKANMLRAYSNQLTDLHDFFHSEHPKVDTFKWLFFSLCIFHGALLERRKFGPLGFNIPYEFTDGDLKISISQLYMFLLEYSDVPFKVLTYTAGHINYGGRVTDDWDRRCLMNILADYYKPEILNESYVYDKAGFYHQLPGDTSLLDYMDYMKTFPLNDDPSLFGLHDNADITCAQATAYGTLATLLTLQPKEVGAASTNQEEQTATMARTILAQVPEMFDVDAILEKYPVLYEESLNTVIVQEAIRYNRLLIVIATSLKDLLKALKGLVVMSEALEKMSVQLFTNIVPDLWAGKAYPSLKPLGAWVEDLNKRTDFLQQWVNQGIPNSFWISGFYFPQAFLTGTLQNFARKYVVSIDTIGFRFEVLPGNPQSKPKDGCAIFGLFLEGCRWNAGSRLLDESKPKELYTEMVPILMVPEENHAKPNGVYECPVYKTLKRAGVLSTTGHSTNYVIACEIPSDKPEKHWIQRGVALFCALDY